MIQYIHTSTGATIYALVFNTDGTIRDVAGDSWVTIDEADTDDYDIPLAEASASRVYQAADPSGLDATTHYPVAVFLQGGGSPAIATDELLGIGVLNDHCSASILTRVNVVVP